MVIGSSGFEWFFVIQKQIKEVAFWGMKPSDRSGAASFFHPLKPTNEPPFFSPRAFKENQLNKLPGELAAGTRSSAALCQVRFLRSAVELHPTDLPPAEVAELELVAEPRREVDVETRGGWGWGW